MTDPLRAALIGYGLAGRVFHRPLIGAEPRMTVSHVVTRDPGRRAEVTGDVPGVQLVDDARALWARAQEFDVVVVATPNDSHLDLALASIELGKPTVVDKPLAVTSVDASRAASAATVAGVALAVFQNRRWDSDTLAARALIESGDLGDVVRLESRFTRFRPEVAQRWREEPAAGGVLLDLGSHVVDQALHLLGPAVSVYAEVDRRRVGATADDDCFLALTHRSGARSHLWASMAAPVPGPRLLLQGSAAGWSKDDLDGQEDALRAGWTPADSPLDEPAGRLVDGAGARPVPSPPGDYGAFYRLFAAAVLDGGPVPVPADAGVAVLEVLDAARRSAERSQVVRLPS